MVMDENYRLHSHTVKIIAVPIGLKNICVLLVMDCKIYIYWGAAVFIYFKVIVQQCPLTGYWSAPTCQTGFAHGWWVAAWGSCPVDREEKVTVRHVIVFVRWDDDEITGCFLKQPGTVSENLLAGCAILLPGYDGKVVSYCPQAGEDLEDRNGRLNVWLNQMWSTSCLCLFTASNTSTCLSLIHPELDRVLLEMGKPLKADPVARRWSATPRHSPLPSRCFDGITDTPICHVCRSMCNQTLTRRKEEASWVSGVQTWPVYSVSLHANLNCTIKQYWIHHLILLVKWAQVWRTTHARVRQR